MAIAQTVLPSLVVGLHSLVLKDNQSETSDLGRDGDSADCPAKPRCGASWPGAERQPIRDIRSRSGRR